MRTHILRIAVVLCALAVVLTVTWRVWREWYSADEIRAAQEAGDAAKVCRLLRWGARAEEVENLLHWAAGEDHPAVAEILLDNGAEVDAKTNDNFGWTPLHLAASNDHITIAKLLLENGANVDAQDNYVGLTPLRFAANQNNPAVVNLLLAFGADANAKDAGGWTPLHLTAIRGHRIVAKLLLAFGADANVKNSVGKTPLDLWPELAEIVKQVEAEKAGKKQLAQPKVATP